MRLGLSSLGLGARSPAWTPASLFLDGRAGVWFDPSDLSTMYQDAGGSSPVAANGDPVGLIRGTGNSVDGTQSTAAARPTFGDDGSHRWIETDGSDDFLATTLDIAQPVSIVIAVRPVVIGSASANDVLLGGDGNPNSSFTMELDTGGFSIYGGAALGYTTTPSTSTTYIYSASWNGGSSLIRVNGSQVASGSAGGSGFFDISLGKSTTLDRFAAFRTYGVVIANMTQAEIQRTERFLARKSGVAL